MPSPAAPDGPASTSRSPTAPGSTTRRRGPPRQRAAQGEHPEGSPVTRSTRRPSAWPGRQAMIDPLEGESSLFSRHTPAQPNARVTGHDRAEAEELLAVLAPAQGGRGGVPQGRPRGDDREGGQEGHRARTPGVVTELASVERQIDELTGAMGRLRTQMALDDPVNMEQKLAALRQALDNLPPSAPGVADDRSRAPHHSPDELMQIFKEETVDVTPADGRQGRVRGLPRRDQRQQAGAGRQEPRASGVSGGEAGRLREVGAPQGRALGQRSA